MFLSEILCPQTIPAAILNFREFAFMPVEQAQQPLYSPENAAVWKGCLTVLMIRLARVGARKQPYYRVVVIEKSRARNGRSVEVVGTYNPRTNPASVTLKQDRIDYWTAKGAQLSERVATLVAKQGAPAAA